ncbi:MAG: hypothetical protein M0Z36_12745 [Thermaerobacter sp.]|nr:hypothetical protein [Thermaerobacter sp.]
MKNRALWAAALATGFLAGCGTVHGTHPISHGMTPQEVKNEVLARIRDWHAVTESATEVVKGIHHGRQTYRVTLTSQLPSGSFRLTVVPRQGAPYVVVNNGLNAVEYRQGARHYAVLTASATQWDRFRLLGTNLVKTIESSHAVGVSVKAKQVVLHMTTPIAKGTQAKTTLWFNLDTNMPTQWQETWSGGSITETLTDIHVNPTISSSAFVFKPPPGVTPEVALTAQGTELDLAQARVPFPIVLPPSSQSLQLNNVNVSTQGKNGRVVLLTYQSATQSPVLITESKTLAFKPPSGMSMVRETVGALRVRVGSMPDGGELAQLMVNKTLVVVEGPTTVVDALVTAWGNPTSSSTSPSSP